MDDEFAEREYACRRVRADGKFRDVRVMALYRLVRVEYVNPDESGQYFFWHPMTLIGPRAHLFL